MFYIVMVLNMTVKPPLLTSRWLCIIKYRFSIAFVLPSNINLIYDELTFIKAVVCSITPLYCASSSNFFCFL